jgi:hypothetical protein
MDTIPGVRSRPRWGLIVGAVIVVLVLAAVAAFVLVPRSSTPHAAATTPAAAPSTGTRPADGCLGGSPATSQVVRAAQAKASTSDTIAAAEFAATIARWFGSDPTPDEADEYQKTIDALIAPDASDEFKATYAKGADDVRSGQAAVNDYAITTNQALYYIESSNAAATVVSLLVERVFPSGKVEEGSVTITLVPSDHGWQMKDAKQVRTSAEMKQIGVAFTGGCAS